MKVFNINIQRAIKDAMNKRFTKYFALLTISIFSFIHSWSQANIADKLASFKVYGECIECKERIEGALKLEGIDAADWNVQTKMLNVSYDSSKINLKKIQSKILSVGHDLESAKADDRIYNSLPGCCRYRDDDEKAHAHSNEDGHENPVSGIVVSEDSKGNFAPLEGASIYWSGSTIGTVSDKSGLFKMPTNENNAKLVVSYTGFQTDSIQISGTGQLQIVLASKGQLKDDCSMAASDTQ
ncbi:MAG TPA: carboxypeptidase-like regulatory domain-containing protein [Hanamia sp.]